MKNKNSAVGFLKSDSESMTGVGFNKMIPDPSIPIFLHAKLTEDEKCGIKDLLIDEELSDESINNCYSDLIQITQEIKNISQQSVLLHGERIQRAKKVLANYHDGVFSKWMIYAYGNRQTPYCMLKYYELYQEASLDSRKRIEKAPKRAMYILATRDAPHDEKMNLVNLFGDSSTQDFIKIVQEHFPSGRVKGTNTEIISRLLKDGVKVASKLNQELANLSQAQILRLRDLISLFERLGEQVTQYEDLNEPTLIDSRRKKMTKRFLIKKYKEENGLTSV